MSLKNVVSFSSLNSTLNSIDKITDVAKVTTKISTAANNNKIANESNLVTDITSTSTGIEKLTTEADYLEDGQTQSAQGICRLNNIKGMESSFQKTCSRNIEIAKLCETSKPLNGNLKEVISSNSPIAIKNAIKTNTGQEPPVTVLSETTLPENAGVVNTAVEEAPNASQSISETVSYFNKSIDAAMKAKNGGQLVKAALTANNVLSNEINQIAQGVLLANEISQIQEYLLGKDKDLALKYAISLLDEKGVFKNARAVYSKNVVQDSLKLIDPSLSSESLSVAGSFLSSLFLDPNTISIVQSLLSRNKVLAKVYISGLIKANVSFKNDNNLLRLVDLFVDYSIAQFEIIADNQSKIIDKAEFEENLYTIDPSLSNVVDNKLSSTVDFGDTTSPAFDMGSITNGWEDNSGDYKFEYVSSFEELINEFRAATREITEVVIHWTETFIDQGDLGSEEINKWHEDLGGIGYHFVIKRNGDIQRGRPLNKEGVHADENGHNKYSIGICLVAGYNCPSGTLNKEDYLVSESITGEQFNTLSDMLTAFYTVWPGGQVWGHNDTDPDNAVDPGFDVSEFVYKKFGKINISEYGFEPPLSAAELSSKALNF
jgi:N-acetylmuramoyl-L-alanine amidase